MAGLDAVDARLLTVVSAAEPQTIADVVAVMEAIDAALPTDGDGLKWFNLLYLQVTQKIDLQPPAGGWEDAAYLTRLDVVFAGLYFAAIASYLGGLMDGQMGGDASTPASWAALFGARQRTGVDRIQFALAGMNAHINHDLSLALLQTDADMGLQPGMQSAEHDDYERVNGILAQVLPQALTFLAVDCLGVAAQDTGKIGQLLAIWDVGVARDAAWDFANHLRSLPDAAKPMARVAQDRMTGVVGRSLLLALK